MKNILKRERSITDEYLRLVIKNNICELRSRSLLTQKATADIVGVSCRQYARYESGNQLPSITSLYRIAILFDVTMDALCRPQMVVGDHDE